MSRPVSGPAIFTARRVFLAARSSLEGGGVVVSRGRIVRVLANRGAVLRLSRSSGARIHDLGPLVLAPGFVDAHAHLELSGLGRALPGAGSFAGWIRALVRARSGLTRSELAASARRGAALLLSSGTTCVGDIDSTGAGESASRRGGLRTRLYREVLDAGDPVRGSRALARASRSFPRSERTFPGISPHAPYTAGPEVFAAAADLAGSRSWPVAIHWAETKEETQWLEHESGPFRDLLKLPPRRGSRGTSGLTAIAEAGLLSPKLALVHGNHPARGDVRRVAESGASLVHCPGTHAFFGRPPFALRTWLAAGVDVALGTDGLSSNAALDMRREMRLLREAHTWLSPEHALEMATRAGARALGFEGRAGELVPGAWADFVAHDLADPSEREWSRPRVILDGLTRGRSRIAAVWISGRAVRT